MIEIITRSIFYFQSQRETSPYIMQTKLSVMIFEVWMVPPPEGISVELIPAVPRGGDIPITFLITLGGRDERKTTN